MVHLNVKIVGIRPRFEKDDPFEMVIRDCAYAVIFTAESGYTYFYDLDSSCDVKITLIGDDLVNTNCSRTMKEIEGDVDQFIITYPDGKKKHYDVLHDTFALKLRDDVQKENNNEDKGDESKDKQETEENYHDVNETTDDEFDEDDE